MSRNHLIRHWFLLERLDILNIIIGIRAWLFISFLNLLWSWIISTLLILLFLFPIIYLLKIFAFVITLSSLLVAEFLWILTSNYSNILLLWLISLFVSFLTSISSLFSLCFRFSNFIKKIFQDLFILRNLQSFRLSKFLYSFVDGHKKLDLVVL